MRSVVFVLIAAGCVVPAFGAYKWRPVQQQEAAFSAQYLSIAQEAPDRLLTLFEAAIPVCMPSASPPLLKDIQVATLAAEAMLKSGTLMAGNNCGTEFKRIQSLDLPEIGQADPEPADRISEPPQNRPVKA
jgi:hypothetical protein